MQILMEMSDYFEQFGRRTKKERRPPGICIYCCAPAPSVRACSLGLLLAEVAGKQYIYPELPGAFSDFEEPGD